MHASRADSPAPRRLKEKLLIIELWGLGDLILATPFIQAASETYEIHLIAKPHAAALLATSYPNLSFINFDAPWTKFEGKYRLWEWPWSRLFSIIRLLRRERFDLAVSVRSDPRDHLLLWFSGARRRISFVSRGTGVFLTSPLRRDDSVRHRVEDWRSLCGTIGLSEAFDPLLEPGEQVPLERKSQPQPVLMLHTGARIGVRRWPESYFADVIARMRKVFQFELILVPDPDGYGQALRPQADFVLTGLSLSELIQRTARVNLLLCNDSGPMHIAAALGVPTIAIFGPTEPRTFGPWGADHKIIVRDLCVYRPCFDYCKFPEPYCLTRLLPEVIWSELEDHIRSLLERDVLPKTLLRPDLSATRL